MPRPPRPALSDRRALAEAIAAAARAADRPGRDRPEGRRVLVVGPWRLVGADDRLVAVHRDGTRVVLAQTGEEG